MDQADYDRLLPVLNEGKWRALGFNHQRTHTFLQELNLAGYELLPLCPGCRMGLRDVRLRDGVAWHCVDGQAATKCRMP